MEEKIFGLEELDRAKAGSICPIYKTLPFEEDELDFFKKISDYGRKKDSVLLESADIITKYGEKSIGSSDPCLKVRGIGEKFEIIALNSIGEKFLDFIFPKLGFATNLDKKKNRITGIVKKSNAIVSESEKLMLKTQADVLRQIAFSLEPVYKPFTLYAGLIGAISYDFIDQFEELPKNKNDPLGEPDFEMNFYDNLFIVDHKKNTITFVANALLFKGNETGSEKQRCLSKIKEYESTLKMQTPIGKKPVGKKMTLSSDTAKEEFVKIVSELKQNVLNGDVFQVVPSRTMISEYSAEPLDIYSSLRKLNPSPYMFYFSNSTGILLGSSPETFLKVSGDKEKTVEIRPIAGTKPRGFVQGKIDPDLDSRYEAELKNDSKEIAEHTMLIDLARNDIARVSKPGSRHCDRPYMVEKYSHVQHLVSNVTGILRGEYDALHAYLASMNMGTLTGAPKVEAMKLLRLKEKNKRGFYGGSIGYLTPSKEFDSAIVIRSMSLKNGNAFVRAGAGIVYDSDPESEFLETEKKARACLKAIELAEESK